LVSSGEEGGNMNIPNLTGGISLFAHMLIITYYRVIKKYPAIVLSFLVIVGIATMGVINVRKSVTNSLKYNDTPKVLGAASVCVPVNQADSDKKIILRVDDIQAFAYEEISKMMIKDAARFNMRMTLGVIPDKFLQDKFFDRVIKSNNCNLELAMHGWDHSSSEESGEFEFENMGEEEATGKIEEGKKILEEIGGQPVVTFIPPGNEISDATKKVLEEEGIRYLSADNESSEYGMNATTFDFPNKKLIEISDVMEACEKRFDKGKNCVIVIHPQDYLTDDKIDQEKYQQYIGLLEELRNKEVKSVTFSDL
jgi:peptidoglycan/xylan/chitin deacetylase (PgdA/CDA1 family)